MTIFNKPSLLLFGLFLTCIPSHRSTHSIEKSTLMVMDVAILFSISNLIKKMYAHLVKNSQSLLAASIFNFNLSLPIHIKPKHSLINTYSISPTFMSFWCRVQLKFHPCYIPTMFNLLSFGYFFLCFFCQ